MIMNDKKVYCVAADGIFFEIRNSVYHETVKPVFLSYKKPRGVKNYLIPTVKNKPELMTEIAAIECIIAANESSMKEMIPRIIFFR